MTDRKPVPEPTLAVQRMAERLMHSTECSHVQPITLPAISGKGEDHVSGSIVDQWGAALILTQSRSDGLGLDTVVLDFVQAETLYTILDQFFNT